MKNTSSTIVTSINGVISTCVFVLFRLRQRFQGDRVGEEGMVLEALPVGVVGAAHLVRRPPFAFFQVLQNLVQRQTLPHLRRSFLSDFPGRHGCFSLTPVYLWSILERNGGCSSATVSSRTSPDGTSGVGVDGQIDVLLVRQQSRQTGPGVPGASPGFAPSAAWRRRQENRPERGSPLALFVRLMPTQTSSGALTTDP